jgi:hypothetical protein
MWAALALFEERMKAWEAFVGVRGANSAPRCALLLNLVIALKILKDRITMFLKLGSNTTELPAPSQPCRREETKTC